MSPRSAVTPTRGVQIFPPSPGVTDDGANIGARADTFLHQTTPIHSCSLFMRAPVFFGWWDVSFPPLFRGLRRFVNVVRRGAGCQAELKYVTTGIDFNTSRNWKLRSNEVACNLCIVLRWWLDSRLVSVLDSGAEGPGFKSQPRRCLVTVLGKLFTPVVPLFTKQRKSTGVDTERNCVTATPCCIQLLKFCSTATRL